MKELTKFGVEFHEAELGNGSKVFLFERKGMPIHLRAIFYAGSRFDNIPGTAHYLEHMLVAGTEKFPSKNLLADHIQKIGGDFGASTSQDVISLWVEVPEATDLSVGIEILSECLTKSLFDPKTIENERGAIISELKSKESSPSRYIFEVDRKIAFQNTNLEFGNLGSESDVEKINVEILKEHYKKYIHSGRLVFVASGDIAMSDLVEELNKISLPSGEAFKPSEPVPIFSDIKELDVPYAGTSQLHVSLVRRILPPNYKEKCALIVLNYILANGRGSRLVTELRYKNGLIYVIDGHVMVATDWGKMSILLSCDRKNYDETINLIYKEFEKMKDVGITDDELMNVKSRISKGIIRNLQTSSAWVGFHGDTCLYEPNDPKIVLDYINTVQSLTRNEINEVIHKYLNKEDFLVAICGNR